MDKRNLAWVSNIPPVDREHYRPRHMFWKVCMSEGFILRTRASNVKHSTNRFKLLKIRYLVMVSFYRGRIDRFGAVGYLRHQEVLFTHNHKLLLILPYIPQIC